LVYEDAKKLLLDDYANKQNKSLRKRKNGKVTVGGLAQLDAFFEANKVLSISVGRLQEYIEKRQAAKAQNGTVNRELALLRRMLNLLAHHYSEYRVPHFPMLKEAEPRQGFLPYEDFLTLRAKLPETLHRIVTLCYETGVRLGEAMSIRWEQIDLYKKLITLAGAQTKSGKPRTIPVSDELSIMLKAQFQTGVPFPATNLEKAWNKARKEAKLPYIRFHDMRRSAVTNMSNAGVSPATAMAVSGHRTISVFLRYNIATATAQQDALQRVIDARAKEKRTV
jgi:integrase